MAVHVRPFQNQEEELLRALVQAQTTPRSLYQRAQCILLSAQRQKPPAISKEVGLGGDKVRKWIHRFNEYGLLGLFDLPRCGRPPDFDMAQVLPVLARESGGSGYNTT